MDRTYLAIDRSAIRNNILSVSKSLGKDVKIMCLVKADAYGHGAVGVAKSCADIVDYFGVATVDEGVELRQNGIVNPILVIGDAPPCKYLCALEYGLQLTVHSLCGAVELNCYCKSVGKTAPVHIAIDSGMGRIGFLCDEIDQVKKVFAMRNLHIKGIFSHFSKADENDKTYTRIQNANFLSVVERLSQDGCDVGIRHIANSAAVLDLPDFAYGMVRMGIMTYGLYPSIDVSKSIILSPALSWYARICHIKTLPKGSPVGYGGDFVTPAKTSVATLSVGYGDGYPRALSNKGCVLIGGQKAPIIGRICMDQTMVDITHIGGIKVGDSAVLIGKQGDLSITAEDVAEWANTVNYEIICGISHRVLRKFI